MKKRVRTVLLTSVISISGVVLHSDDALARCARQTWIPRVLSRGVLAANESIVVGLQSTYSYEGAYEWSTTPAGTAVNAGRTPALTLRRGATTIALRGEVLGPGLFRFTPSTAPAAGAWEVIGLARTETVQFGAAATGGNAPSAPNIRAASFTDGEPIGRGRAPNRTVQLNLAARIPENVIAVLVSFGTAATPSFYSVVPQGAGLSLRAYESPGRCGSELPGATAPTAPGPLTVRWVDNVGRVSTPVSVTMAAAPAPASEI